MAPRLADARHALGVTLRNPVLGRVQAGFGLAWTTEAAFTVALGVYAFQEGGASGVGLIGLIRLAPSGLLGPIMGAYSDRVRRERILIASSAARAVTTVAIGVVVAADGPLVVVYVLAALSSIAATPYRSANSSLLPSLCRTTDELTASTIVRGMLDSASVVVGSFAVALLIELTSTSTTFFVAGAVSALAALAVVGLRYDRPPRVVDAPHAPTVRAAVAEGLRASFGNRETGWLIVLATAQTFTRGCLNVFAVVVAIDLLGTGESGTGVLQGAVGVGAITGSIGTVLLVGSHRLGRWLAASVTFWGLPLCFIGVFPNEGFTLVMLGVIGLSNAVLDVALFTLLCRIVDDHVLGRVYGVFESLVALTIALGSIVSALLIDAMGVRGALGVLGTVGPLTALLAWSTLVRLDDTMRTRQASIDVLQQVPLLRSLPVPTIEHLARHLRERRLDASEWLIRSGTVGTGYYVVVAGTLDVEIDATHVRHMGPGEGVGEIALLRDSPRTADVRASSDGPVELYEIDQVDFLAAVTGMPESAREAAETVTRWLADDAAR